MDHALACNSSKSPGKDHHVKGPVWTRQPLSSADTEAHVSSTDFPGGLLGGCDSLLIRINAFHAGRERSDTEGEAAVAAPQVQYALPEHECGAAPLGELIDRSGPEGRRECRNVPANVADWAGCTEAHAKTQLNRAGQPAPSVRARPSWI